MPNSIDSFDPFIYDTPITTGFFKGYISNFRITTGQALYTGNFAAPNVDTLTTTTVGVLGSNVASSISPGSVLVLSFVDNDVVTKNSSNYGNILLTAYGMPTVNTIKTGLSYNQPVVRRDETSPIRMQYFDKFDAGDVILIKDSDSGFTATANVISADYNSLSFNSIEGFPTDYLGGMTVQNLSSFVKPTAQVLLTDWRSASTPQERLLASRYTENTKTVRLNIDRNLGENITSNIGILQSLTPIGYTTEIPGDLRLVVTGIDTTPFGNTVSFYLNDNDFLIPYTRNTGNVTTLSFAYQDAVPFAVNSNVRIIDTTTGFTVTTQVIAATNSSVTANVFVANVGATLYVEKDYSLVYPQSLVKTTTKPQSPRELYYYLSVAPQLYGYRNSIPDLRQSLVDNAFLGNLTIQSNLILDFPNSTVTDRSTSLGRYWFSTLAPGKRGVVVDTASRLITHQSPIVPYQVLDKDLDDYFGNNIRRGEITYTLPGTYIWTAPPGVTRVSVVAVGGGGGGSNHGEGGGGGGLGWGNVAVSPGQSYTIRVGEGGRGGALSTGISLGSNGGDSWFLSNATVAGFGGSGGGVAPSQNGNPGGEYVGEGGGRGGSGGTWTGSGFRAAAGGGGAGGYLGSGGRGGDAHTSGTVPTNIATSAVGGGGGGGAGAYSSPSIYEYVGSAGGGGGGVGLLASGTSGAAGTYLPQVPYETMTYTVTGSVTLTNNGTTEVTMFKTGSNNVWDSQVYSLQPFTAPCTIEFTKNAGGPGDNGAGYAMIGWNSDPTTNASYDTLDWCSYPYRTDSYSVHHNGTEVQFGGAWDVNKRFYIVYDTDGWIRHYNGSTLLYQVSTGTGRTVYFDSSFYSQNATFGGFTNVKIVKLSWDGTAYRNQVVGGSWGGGSGGSGGQTGTNGFGLVEFIPRDGQPGGLYGGGGSGGGPIGTAFNYAVAGGNGAGGAVRIVYGTGVAYPTTSNAAFTTGNAVVAQTTYSIITTASANKPRDLLYFAQRVPGYKGVSALNLSGGTLMINKGSFVADEKEGTSKSLDLSLGNILKLGLKKGNIWQLWQDFPLDQRIAVLNQALERLNTVPGIEQSFGINEVAKVQLKQIGPQIQIDGLISAPKEVFIEVIDFINRADNRYFSYLQKQVAANLVDVLDKRFFGRLEARYKFNIVDFAVGFALVPASDSQGRLEIFKLPANRQNSLHELQRKKDPVTFWS